MDINNKSYSTFCKNEEGKNIKKPWKKWWNEKN